MKKYVCSICGYVYDEEKGIPEKGINPGTKWEDLPDDFKCPWCGAPKTMFNQQGENNNDSKEKQEKNDAKEKKENEISINNHDEDLRMLSFGELSAICSNLSKACEKQFLEEESKLFSELSNYYKNKIKKESNNNDFSLITSKIEKELETNYPAAKEEASSTGDRGTLRVLTWSEKVTMMLNQLLKRYKEEGKDFIEKTNVYVCDICGFIFIADDPPKICPVCKVPNIKILKVDRR